MGRSDFWDCLMASTWAICRSTDIRGLLVPAIDSGGVMQQERSDLGSSPSV